MYQVGVEFKILQDREHIPVGYKKGSGHLIFDIKMDFTRSPMVQEQKFDT